MNGELFISFFTKVNLQLASFLTTPYETKQDNKTDTTTDVSLNLQLKKSH